MQACVISLPQSGDRRAHIDAQFRACGIDFEFFDAVEGAETFSDHFEAHDEQAYLVNTGRTASPGEIGCYASHLTLWKRCVTLNTPLLILEDDARLEPNFSDAFDTAANLVEEFGFIRLQKEWKKRKTLVCRYAGFGVYSYPSFPLGAQCYAVSPVAARALISRSYLFSAPVDVFIKRYWEHGQPLFSLLPHAVSLSHFSELTTIKREAGVRSLRLQTRRFVAKGKLVARRTSFNLLQQFRQLRTD